MDPCSNWPDDEEERLLLTNLASGSRTARESVAVQYQPLLVAYLAIAFPWVDADLRDDAADRALVDLLCGRTGFDPARGSLGGYLRMAARGDLHNLLAREARACRHHVPLDSVAEPMDGGNKVCADSPTWDDPRLVAGVASLDLDERTVLDLMRDGVRDTGEFARYLKLDHLCPREQVVAVKRVKDRVKKRLVRAVGDQS